MIKNSIIYILVLLALQSGASAQTISSSPYSQFGLGTLKESLLPQNRAMGGIGAGLGRLGAYNNVNLANPASYADIRMTTIDIGIFGGLTSLQKNTVKQDPIFSGSLSHLVFGIPVSKKSAISFGVVPYSDLGYKYKVAGKVDTNSVNYIYSGDGGLSKAYLGYGFKAGKHFNLGLNVNYLFGKLEQSGSAEFLYGTASSYNSRNAKSNAIGGLNYDYGVQYSTFLNKKTRLTLGYSGSTANKIKLAATNLNTLYIGDEANGITEDTISTSTVTSRIQLPVLQRAGFSIEHTNKWLLGADISYGGWSAYRIAGTNPGLHNSLTASIGGQITPDLNTISNYLKLIDYRFGLKYSKTYISINNNTIKDAALTLGLGLPLPSNHGVSFYKINLSSELGQRGSLQNGLIRERYANFYLGITLNDLWFQKFKFD